MNTDFLKDLNDKTKEAFGPVAKFNDLLSQSVQEAFKVQMESTKKYSELATEQFKAMSEIRDAESLQDFFKSQMDAFGRLNEQMMSDLKGLTETGTKFREELEEIVKASTQQEVDDKAKPASKSKSK